MIEKQNRMKKSTLLRIGIVVFVVIAAIALIYNYYLISPTTHYAGVDKFGIKEIYPTKTGGEEWFMNMDDPGNDPRIGGEGPPSKFVQQNDDGSWKVRSTEVRYGVLTSSGYQIWLPLSISKPWLQRDTCNHPMIGRA